MLLQEESDDDDPPEIGVEALRPEALSALQSVLTAERREDFSLSQFWFTEACVDALAHALRTTAPSAKLAILSCPTLHAALHRAQPNDASWNLEYDERFRAANFVAFDYRRQLDASLAGGFDLIVVDPPYVSRAVLEEYWRHACFLAATDSPRLVAMTSVVNRPWLVQEYRVQLTRFELAFESKLATPLRVFTNDAALGEALGGFEEAEEV